jgi:hypothetical protein
MQVAMTQEQFTQVVAGAKEHGIDLAGEQGIIQKMGVKASWAYDGAMMTVEILEKPFFMTKEAVESKLKELVMKRA